MPQGAFYAMVKVRAGGLGETAHSDRLLEEVGVATVAGTSFGTSGEDTSAYPSLILRQRCSRPLDRIEGWLDFS